ncbi:MAG: PAS domain S-box protein [Gemmatimonadales bacterium]|nr:PAS domain S-box protein [Gemmatimonadales bacterium]
MSSPPTDGYRAVFESSPDGTLVMDAEGKIWDANPEACLMFGWSREGIIGLSVDALVPESLRDGHHAHRARFAEKPHNRPMGISLDLYGERKDGSVFPVEISLSPWHTADGQVRVICAVRDITIRKRLQNFSEGALRATEDERQRIARELHDDTAQRLATLILRARVLAEEPDAAARVRLLGQIREEIVQAADGVKRISRGLRPPELEEVGLAAALIAHFRNLNEGTGFQVHADLDAVESHLSLNAKLALYRIVQEAISNVMRHSGVEHAKVTLIEKDGYVVAEIADTGRGFLATGMLGDGRGLGLVGMHERAAMLGAGLTIDSVPEKGTHIRVAIPVSGETS